MNILGFNCFGHDSSASLVVDGRTVFAVEEERLVRRKHYGGFPIQSIRECLAFANLKLSDLDHVAFFWKPSLSLPMTPYYFLRFLTKMPRLLRESREWTMEENLGMLNYWRRMNALPGELRAAFPDSAEARFRFHLLEHHFCHAASAFYPSPFEEAAILTIDGGGEWTTAMLSHGSGRRIRKLAGVNIPYSLGAFYQSIARHLGFHIITGPGKLMGLSAYGRRESPVYARMKRLFHLLPDGRFKMDLSYFAYPYTRKTGVSPKFEREFGVSKSKAENFSDRELDVAAAAQRIVEDMILHMANALYRKTRCTDLAIAGGVGLNSVANGRLVSESPFKRFFIQPASGDSGTSLGAALFLHHQILNQPRRHAMEHAFLGPSYGAARYRSALESAGFSFLETERVYEISARLLKEEKILGWFQDRLEFGPRALGNRSILTTPCRADMKDILNARVKFRESFRPFAPIVLEEHCVEYFGQSHPSPYMLLVYPVRPEKREVIPAVTHVDGSARVQTVNARENPPMWKLLNAFLKEAGVPVLLNTSFNIKGEPIVCTPEEAADSFRRSDIDYLVIGNFIAAKKKEDLDRDAFRIH